MQDSLPTRSYVLDTVYVTISKAFIAIIVSTLFSISLEQAKLKMAFFLFAMNETFIIPYKFYLLPPQNVCVL